MGAFCWQPCVMSSWADQSQNTKFKVSILYQEKKAKPFRMGSGGKIDYVHKSSATVIHQSLLFATLRLWDFLCETSDPRRHWNGRHKQAISIYN